MTPKLTVLSGDVLDQPVDLLICTANPMLRMTGGVNGALLQRGGLGVQRELEAYLRRVGRRWVPPGTVVRTGPGPLAVRHVLHAVSVDGFYKADHATVRDTLLEALAQAAQLGARSVATPALATGYGPLSVEDFAQALAAALAAAPAETWGTVAELTLVLRREADVAAAVEVLAPHLRGVP